MFDATLVDDADAATCSAVVAGNVASGFSTAIALLWVACPSSSSSCSIAATAATAIFFANASSNSTVAVAVAAAVAVVVDVAVVVVDVAAAVAAAKALASSNSLAVFCANSSGDNCFITEVEFDVSPSVLTIPEFGVEYFCALSAAAFAA